MQNIPVMDCGDGIVRAETGVGRAPVAKTAAYQILASEAGTTFTNAGASGSVTFTPPLSAAKAAAMGRLGVGLLDKVTLLYSADFWTKQDLGYATWFEVVDPTKSPSSPQAMREFFNAALYFGKPVVTMLTGSTTCSRNSAMTRMSHSIGSISSTATMTVHICGQRSAQLILACGTTSMPSTSMAPGASG